jgi:tRNA(fMet)-specific endonuclease VapC
VVSGGYLLDTNVLSEPLRPRPDAEVLRRLAAHRGEVLTAAPVWHELVYGCQRLPPSRRRTLLERYLREVVEPTMRVLPYDRIAAARHGAERARLSALGWTPAFVDGQIAAIAQANALVLVTRNVRDFEHFEGLSSESWFRGGESS